MSSTEAEERASEHTGELSSGHGKGNCGVANPTQSAGRMRSKGKRCILHCGGSAQDKYVTHCSHVWSKCYCILPVQYSQVPAGVKGGWSSEDTSLTQNSAQVQRPNQGRVTSSREVYLLWYCVDSVRVCDCCCLLLFVVYCSVSLLLFFIEKVLTKKKQCRNTDSLHQWNSTEIVPGTALGGLIQYRKQDRISVEQENPLHGISCSYCNAIPKREPYRYRVQY